MRREITCLKCDTTTRLEIPFEAFAFVCPKCGSVYEDSDQGFRFTGREIKPPQGHEPFFDIGTSGVIDGTRYTITGSILKKAFGTFFWTEYALVDDAGQIAFLSEATGHWILLRELKETLDFSQRPVTMDYYGTTFRQYEYYDAQISAAQGFFDFEITSAKIKVREYLAPPEILSVETINNEQAVFHGVHVSRSSIKSAFKRAPIQTGVGLVQPFLIPVRSLFIAACIAAIAILMTHWYLSQGRSEQQVFDATLYANQSNEKEYVGPPFTLIGPSAPLTVRVATNADNSWANVQVGLVNEANSDEVYANQDVEMYHGYEGGEHWSEGARNQSFNICGVAAGRYHLVVTPLWPSEEFHRGQMQVSASWDKPSMWNVWLPIVIMFAVALALYFLNTNFEQRRWAESSYSPFD